MLQANEKLPEFKLLNQDEKEITSQSLLGRKYILFFYPKANTPGCSVEASDFSNLKEDFLNKGYLPLGISKDSIKAQKSFALKKELKLDLLCDSEMDLIKKCFVWGEKKNYGKTTMGIIRTTLIIDENGKLEHCLYNVRAKGHAQRILELL